MSDKTGIQWTEVPDGAGGVKRGATWNPVTGCTHVSAGCDHCYAETLALRLQAMGQPKYRNGFAVTLHPDTLTIPLRWSKPRGIFVNSMSDLFHADIPRDFLDRVFAVMALTPQHTYQVLTKRPQRAANYLADMPRVLTAITAAMQELTGATTAALTWPLPNVWLGTSVEDRRVLHRIVALLRCPAAIRFLSCEPLLGPLDLSDYLYPVFAADDPRFFLPGGRGVDWVIVGGESGPQHRPLDLDWARDLRDQCQTWGVPYFFKQIGGLTPKSGGRLLDGVEWSEFPSVALPVEVAVQP